MTLDAMTFASEIHDEILDHQLTDEYAAALLAMERGEPEGRARVLAPMPRCSPVPASMSAERRPI